MGVKIKNIWNHHPEDLSITPWYCMVGPWSSPVSPRHTTCLRYSSTATTGQPLSKAWVCLQKGKPKHKLHCFKIHKKNHGIKVFNAAKKGLLTKKKTHIELGVNLKWTSYLYGWVLMVSIFWKHDTCRSTIRHISWAKALQVCTCDTNPRPIDEDFHGPERSCVDWKI